MNMICLLNKMVVLFPFFSPNKKAITTTGAVTAQLWIMFMFV